MSYYPYRKKGGFVSKVSRQFSLSEKIDYYRKRSSDPNVTESQRQFALDRLRALKADPKMKVAAMDGFLRTAGRGQTLDDDQPTPEEEAALMKIFRGDDDLKPKPIPISKAQEEDWLAILSGKKKGK